MDTDHSRYIPGNQASSSEPLENSKHSGSCVNSENSDNSNNSNQQTRSNLTIIHDETPSTSAPLNLEHNSLADYVCVIFSPLLLPTYCMAVAMWITPLKELPERARLWSTMMVFLITSLIPMAIILGLIKSGHIHNFDITRRRERVIPLIAIGLCYLAAGIYLYRLHAPQWLAMLYFGGCVITFLYSIISPIWKISGHSSGMGTLIGMFVWITVNHLTEISMMPWISIAILLTGIVGSARVYLNKHTVSQVIAGATISSILTYIAMDLSNLLSIQEPIIIN